MTEIDYFIFQSENKSYTQDWVPKDSIKAS